MTDSELSIYISASILGMLFIGLLVVWFLNRAQMKISNEKIKVQEQQLAFRKNLLLNTVKTQENERARIAKELHDDVTSQLGIIHLNLHLLHDKISKDEEAEKILDQVEQSLKNSTERTRTISHELMPAIFKKFGFFHSLNELANSINLNNLINFTIKDEHELKIIDQFKLLHIYRMIQEMINNSLKYAKASELLVQFSPLEGGIIQMTYEDNGVGFDSDKKSEGLGMDNLRTRIELLNGELHIYSKIGHGTRIVSKFPNYD